MLRSELIEKLQKQMDKEGDGYVYVCNLVGPNECRGVDIVAVAMDCDDSTVIDTIEKDEIVLKRVIIKRRS